MSESELSRLFAAERAEAPSAARAERGWETLQGALRADVPALAVAHGPLQLGLSLATKSMIGSGLIAFAVTTAGLGAHTALQAPAATAPPAVIATAPATVAPVAPPVVDVERELTPAIEPIVSAVPLRPRISSDAPSTFAEELRLIKAAKLELDAGRPHLARVWLEQHRRQYPSGVFRTERIELLRRLESGTFPDHGGDK